MGLITYTTPGTELTQAEYDGNFTNIYDEFNGSIDNSNIKPAAGIVDTKLATISSSGKVAETAIPSIYSSAKTFNAGIIAANAGGVGATVSDGLTVSTGGITVTAGGVDINAGGITIAGGTVIEDTGLTVTAGGITVTAGGVDINAGGITIAGGATVEDTGLTITAGGITVTAGGLDIASGNSVDVKGVNGIDYNTGGTDTNVDLITVQVSGTPTLSWGETANRFQMSRGLDVTSGSITVANDLTVTNDITITNNNLTLTNGNIILTAGGATVDGVDISAHDAATSNIHGTGAGNSVAGVRYVTKNFTSLTASAWNTVTLTSTDIGADFNTAGVSAIGSWRTTTGGTTGSVISIKDGATSTRATAHHNGGANEGLSITEGANTSLSFRINPGANTSADLYVMIFKA